MLKVFLAKTKNKKINLLSSKPSINYFDVGKNDRTKLENCKAKNPEKLVSSSYSISFCFFSSLKKLLIGFLPNIFLSFFLFFFFYFFSFLSLPWSPFLSPSRATDATGQSQQWKSLKSFSFYLSVCLFVYLFICLSFICLSFICLSLYLSIFLFVYQSFYLSIFLFVYLSICLSFYLSICLFVFHFCNT